MHLSFAVRISFLGVSLIWILLWNVVPSWKLKDALSPPGLTEKQDKTINLLLTTQIKERLELAFNKHLQKELERLDKIKRVASFEEMLTTFKNYNVPRGTLVRFSAILTKQQLQEMAKIDFEIELFRIRGTQNWIALKGGAGAVTSRDVGPLYLFDLSIHNHPTASEIPSAPDVRTDFEDNLGNATDKIIIGKNGVTFFNTLNLRNFGHAPYYIDPNEVFFLHEEMLREARNNGIEMTSNLHDPKVITFWGGVTIALGEFILNLYPGRK